MATTIIITTSRVDDAFVAVPRGESGAEGTSKHCYEEAIRRARARVLRRVADRLEAGDDYGDVTFEIREG